MTAIEESVVLMSDAGEPIGVTPKSEVHTSTTALHLAFSLYLFDPDGRLLLTRRALAEGVHPETAVGEVLQHTAAGGAGCDGPGSPV